ncbi:DUF1064 domain-containing protein [Bacillus gobiensis]|uniref:DUF1064 domain-containing protein n=1 Tax=Bacillus gobiensis TaxID=1441095 RepID=UPI003D1B80C3
MAYNKFGAKKTEVDGIVFDSKAEAKYYLQLKWMKQGKQIKDFKVQPRFLLQDAFEKNGKMIRKIEYVADFEIHNLDDSVEIVDVKGHKTREFLLKEKMFNKRYPHKLTLITFDQSLGWIDLDELAKIKRKRAKENGKKGGSNSVRKQRARKIHHSNRVRGRAKQTGS